MRLFHEAGARHFCANFKGTKGTSTGSLRNYLRTLNRTRLIEGTAIFDEYRDCALREVERLLFLAASHYRRSLDLMTAGSAAWAHVTLYYGSFFSAKAFLTMFGGWVDPPTLVEVSRSQINQQELQIHRRLPPPHDGLKGDHKRFWSLFYAGCRSLIHSITVASINALTPVSGSIFWQIDSRNEINYDSYKAFELSEGFQRSFKETSFPTSLPGKLNTQYQITEEMIVLAFTYAKTFNLRTDAVNLLLPAAPRSKVIEKLVYEVSMPDLVAKTKKAQILV